MNAEEQRAFEMVREHEAALKALERRIKALEDLADGKEGAPKKTGARKD